MILHPGILALIVGSVLTFAMLLYAAVTGLGILMRWDLQSSSEEQLLMERKTSLISTLINYAFGFQILSLLLFLYTADQLHPQFVGAMCATGTLNANPAGWNVLFLKIILFFASAFWIAVNTLDQRAEDFPLIRPKYTALLFLTPLVGLDLYFQLRYFTGLHPEVITSCCGALFSERGFAIASGLAGLPPRPMMILFYGVLTTNLGITLLCRKTSSGAVRFLLASISVVTFFVGIASIVSFVSIYIYELPSHHCPFDILQQGYAFIGYPIYLTLFGGVFFGTLPGLFYPMKKIATLKELIERSEQRWILLSALLIGSFTALCSWPVVFGHFTLQGYL